MKINTLADGEQLKKYHVALLVNKGTSDKPEWVQIEKSTDNTITMNAETEDRDYIVDVNPTTILTKYKPSLSEPITLYKGNPDYEFFWSKFYNMDVGSSAVSEILVVFMNEEPVSGKFNAWKCSCACVCDNLNPVDSTLTFTINFNGTVAKGYVEVDDSGNPSFTEGTASAGTDSSDDTSSSSDSGSSDDASGTSDSDSTATTEAATPVFTNTLSDVSYTTGGTADALDGSATVSDGGTVTYKWTDSDGNELSTEATYTPDVTTAGTKTVTVTATNTLGDSTATASQTFTITVADSN